jgi:hypothetical protein
MRREWTFSALRVGELLSWNELEEQLYDTENSLSV